METDTTKHISQILPTSVTPTPANQSPTTQPQPNENWNNKREQEKSERARTFQHRWFKMELSHPKIQPALDDLYEFTGDVFYKRNPSQGRGIVIYGSNGSGKTHLAKAFHQWFNHARMQIGPVQQGDDEGGLDCRIADACFVLWPQVVDGFKEGKWNVVQELIGNYLSIIDDFGAEHDPSRIGEEKLYLILSKRERKFTIITTNASPDEWHNRFERRIVSRLFRNFTHIDLSDVPDFSTQELPQQEPARLPYKD